MARRSRMKKSRSKKLFRKTAGYSRKNSAYSTRPMRGGIRL